MTEKDMLTFYWEAVLGEIVSSVLFFQPKIDIYHIDFAGFSSIDKVRKLLKLIADIVRDKINRYKASRR